MKWGFRWDKVGSGVVMALSGVGGLLFARQIGYHAGYAVLAIVGGVYLILTGLVGEEGIW